MGVLLIYAEFDLWKKGKKKQAAAPNFTSFPSLNNPAKKPWFKLWQ
jgi:hypothetical protein